MLHLLNIQGKSQSMQTNTLVFKSLEGADNRLSFQFLLSKSNKKRNTKEKQSREQNEWKKVLVESITYSFASSS